MLGLFSGELIFGGAYYWKEFCVLKWVWLDNKTPSTMNSPCAYIQEGLLSEGFLRVRFGGLIFGRAYYRNFTVFVHRHSRFDLFIGLVTFSFGIIVTHRAYMHFTTGRLVCTSDTVFLETCLKVSVIIVN